MYRKPELTLLEGGFDRTLRGVTQLVLKRDIAAAEALMQRIVSRAKLSLVHSTAVEEEPSNCATAHK